MTSALLLPDHRPMGAKSIVDAPNVEGIVNNPVTRHLQRLDGQVDIAEKFPFACGRHADIYLGILCGGLDLIGPGVLTDKAISSRLMGPGKAPQPYRRVPSDMQYFQDNVCSDFFLCPHNFAHNFYLAPPLAREVVSQHFNGSISVDER